MNRTRSSLAQEPAAILLNGGNTALATGRCLADRGIKTYVAVFEPNDICCWSRQLSTIDVSGLANDDIGILKWLRDFSIRLPTRPVVFPASDRMALLLASADSELRAHSTFAENTIEDLNPIVSKDNLYEIASRLGLPIPRMLVEPTIEEAVRWSLSAKPPFLAKPFYRAIGNCSLDAKNAVFLSAEQLLDFVGKHGSKKILIQEMIDSGDGHVFDCYGYCDRRGRIVTMASHRRLRQSPPHRGITSYGEIPGHPMVGEQALFDNSRALLGSLNYHGIFGIEWIENRHTGQLYLVDFNARPFTSIGHLSDCGLNLPYVAYKELCGETLDQQSANPDLQHKFWIDLRGDLSSFYSSYGKRQIGLLHWLRSLLRARSFAVFSARDLAPALHNTVSAFLKWARPKGKTIDRSSDQQGNQTSAARS